MESLPSRLRPALFHDRDGVINFEKNYDYRIENFEFNAGIFDLCCTNINRNMPIVVAIHQARIG